MKNLFLVLALFMVASLSAQITFGPKAGVNISKIKDVHGSSNHRTGMFFGGFASIPLQDYSQEFYIQPEVMYSMMGEKDGGNTVNIDYIIVPVLFKAYFSERDTEFFGEVGPQFGFLVSEGLPENYNYEHEYNSFDLGATVGLGFSYLRQWEASLRFYYGFSDAIDKDALDARNFNSNFNFGVAYRF